MQHNNNVFRIVFVEIMKRKVMVKIQKAKLEKENAKREEKKGGGVRMNTSERVLVCSPDLLHLTSLWRTTNTFQAWTWSNVYYMHSMYYIY